MPQEQKDERPVEVVLLSSDFPPGGGDAADLLRQVAAALPAGSAWVSAPKKWGRRREDGDFPCPVHLAPTLFFGTKALGVTLWYADLRRRCRRRHPGICLVGGTAPGPRLASRLLRELAIPYVLHLDDSSFVTWGGDNRLLGARDSLEQLTSEAAAIVVQSQVGWLNAYKLGVYPQHLFRVPPGVDLRRFRPGEVPKQLAKRLALSGGPVLLCAPNERTAVDAETLLRAFEIVWSQRRNAVLIVIGGGEPRLWKRLAHEHGVAAGVRVVAEVSEAELADYFRLADLFVLALPPTGELGSVSDTNGLAYVRAQASGLPLVSTRTPLSEELVPDGEVGVLVEAGAHAKFGRAVLELLRSRGRSSGLSRRARARAEAEFDVARTGQRISELLHVVYYRQLRGARPAPSGEARRRERRSPP